MPWQMSYAASADLDNSELQTDVMRFMAILAFCLVAIFAIVQTMPLEASTETQPEVPQSPAKVVTKTELPVEPVALREPIPVRQYVKVPVKKEIPAATPANKPVQRQQAVPVKKEPAKEKPLPRPIRTVAPRPATPAPKPQPQPGSVPTRPETASPASAAAQGLSLSFESDQVLRSLVERRLVGLYAIKDNNYYEMTVNGQRIQFSPGPAPAQYHEMVYETVPREVARVFEAEHGNPAAGATWGVTLPAGTTRQLRRFVQTNYTGDLVITADAELALAESS